MGFEEPNKGWVENETALPERNKFSTILELQGNEQRIIRGSYIIQNIKGSEYCEETTLHGFQYLRKPGIFNKLLWLVTITGCFSVAAYFGISNTLDYLNVRIFLSQ